MKNRKPVLVFLFMFLTFGIYILYWLFSLIEEINAYNKEEKIKYKNTIIKFICIFSTVVILFSIMILSFDLSVNNEINGSTIILYLICWVLCLYWIITIVKTLWKISIELQQIQIKNNIIAPIEPILTVVLFFIYFIGIIYLQSHINKTVKIIGEEKINIKNSIKCSFIFVRLLFVLYIILFVGLIMNNNYIRYFA